MKKESNTIQIHQFTPSMASGDSVSSAVLYIQSILIEFGFTSNIYVSRNDLDKNLKHDICHLEEYIQNENHILLYHHSIGHNSHDKIMQFKDKKILIYHNITPPHFFKNNPYIQNLCIQGREQLSSSASCFISAIGDSDYNCKELRYYNYKNPTTLPLLLDWEKQKKVTPNQELIKKYHNPYNIIFVGRVVQNKAQHQLVDVAYALKKKGLENFKIHIIGGASEHKYMQALQQYAKNLNILVEVTITGKVSQENLKAYYTLADLYLSLSEHEGFGMPLVEAMRHDVPVLSYNTGGVGSALPKESLLEKKSPDFIANKILAFQKDPYNRVQLIKKQRKKLMGFSSQNIKEKFAHYLNSTINTNIKYKAKKKSTKKTNYQIEGPFDSSYSLAIVNKTIANALHRYLKNSTVKLYSTEGDGDFIPNLKYLDDTTKKLALKSQENVDITIRNLYPPRTNAMKGYHKIIGPFGWEESKFPAQYVQWFNTKLTMIFAVSNYVKELLKNNGVSVPIYTTGNIVEDIIAINSSKLSFDLPQGVRLLHISSCFPRKGVDILIDTFELLSNKKEISLIIKTFQNPHNTVIEYLEKKNYKIESIYEENIYLYSKNAKKIVLINKDIPQSQLKYLYENSDILVAPSLGEGFGLPMAEAMLLDLPVVTTNYGGQIDFCTKKTSWLIDFDFAPSKTHLNLKNSVWVVPKKESLKMKIEEICNLSKKEIYKKTSKAKKYILKHYSSKKVSKKIVKAIKNYGRLQKDQKKKIGWISSYNTKCGVATYSDFIIENLNHLNITIFANYSKTIIDQNKEKNVVRCWNDRFDTTNQTLISNIIKGNFTHIVINFNFAFFSMKNLEEIINQLNKNNIKITIIFHSVKDVKIKGLESSLSWIKDSLAKVSNILVHTIEELNFFKKLGLLNTKLLPHGVKNRIDIKPKRQNKIKTISSYGFMLPHKGILDLIEAFAIVQKQFPYISLVLVNAVYPVKQSKEYLHSCKQRVKELNLSDKITFHSDFLSDKKSYELLDKTDLLVMPYHQTNESVSGAIRYAISTLNPVLCTKQAIFNDIKDIVHFIDGYNSNDIALSIIKLISNKELLYSKTKEQKLWIEENEWKNISLMVSNFLR
ncbi:MAG: hypothetical protein CSA86_02615 [Arcobacter sp.]|nr:MAG: hypothetical protein CSA86_02615 [Arcobacter sp.]